MSVTVGTNAVAGHLQGHDQTEPDYQTYVRDQQRLRTSIRIPNRTWENALFTTKVLFEDAERDVRMISGEIPEVALDHFLTVWEDKKNVPVRLLVWDAVPTGERSEHLHRVLGANEHVKVRFVGSRVSGRHMPHFLVCDSRSFRIEEPHEYGIFGPEKCPEIQAELCFNDPSTARVLVSVFDRLWNQIGHDF